MPTDEMEQLLTDRIAEQYGVKPEEVTLEFIEEKRRISMRHTRFFVPGLSSYTLDELEGMKTEVDELFISMPK